jgi:GT2 family glycosyltransferase
MNISLIVALKNNLTYNKHFYTTTRLLYPDVEICFSSYGSTDGTHEWLESLNDPNIKVFYTGESGNFSDNFNKATSLATKDYIAYLHNDIVLAPGFLENLEKHVGPNNVVSYTTIEPPIFAGHERPGKIIKDLGTDLESFDIKNLYDFALEKQNEYKDKTELGIVFFMCMPRKVNLEIGGLDRLFNPMFCEDDDLILRLKLYGMNLFTSLDAICYHFVSKTSRFSEEYQQKTQQIEQHSIRNFIRKWGSRDFVARYNIGYLVHNINQSLLELLEPWCDNIYIKDSYGLMLSHYFDSESKKTLYNLNNKYKIIGYDEINNDIIIEFDASKLTQDNFQLLTQMSSIIKDSGSIGTFDLNIFKVTINSLETYEKNLIFL